ncbi:MAG: hypothetical protein HY459_04750 [Parcubacteria group bacterium]|nr:hypothetical protein [Parcubacteria group bacterium]
MVPWWILLMVFIWAVGATIVVRNRGFPHYDKGSFEILCPDKKTQDAILGVLLWLGTRPIRRLDTPLASRVVTTNGTIVSIPSRGLMERMGIPLPAVVYTGVSDSPTFDLNAALRDLQQLHIEGHIIRDPDPQLSEGKLALLVTKLVPWLIFGARAHWKELPLTRL